MIRGTCPIRRNSYSPLVRAARCCDQRHGGFHTHAVADHVRQAYAQSLKATMAIHAFGTPTGDILRFSSSKAGSGIPLSSNPLRPGGSPTPGKPDGLAPTTPNVLG